MNILFAWTGLTSYMADCWRQLAAESGVRLKVLIDVSGAGAKGVAFDASAVMRGIDCELFNPSTPQPFNSSTLQFSPDILFAVGWHSPLCRALVSDPRLKDVPKVCCFDMPWRWLPRCIVAPLVLGRFLRHYQAAYVPGAVCTRYARWLGFKTVYRGLFSIDTRRFAPAPAPGTRPSPYLLYIGRDSKEKRLDDLRRAHRLYRESGGTLELRMYGKGLEGGFVKPEEVPALMHGAAAFVLASDFDPWPLVLLEAMSAGCPVIASDKCTNRPELGAHWRVFRVGDVQALARAMSDAERHMDGPRTPDPAVLEYDCKAWVGRVRKIVGELRGANR